MLAYAAQGLPGEDGSASGSQIRDFLRKCEAALTGLGDALTHCVRRLSIQSPALYDAFISVIDRDVRSAQAAIQLVLAQPSISSQLVDNLNASSGLSFQPGRAAGAPAWPVRDLLTCSFALVLLTCPWPAGPCRLAFDP